MVGVAVSFDKRGPAVHSGADRIALILVKPDIGQSRRLRLWFGATFPDEPTLGANLAGRTNREGGSVTSLHLQVDGRLPAVLLQRGRLGYHAEAGTSCTPRRKRQRCSTNSRD
jgi:hypothetical protein